MERSPESIATTLAVDGNSFVEIADEMGLESDTVARDLVNGFLLSVGSTIDNERLTALWVGLQQKMTIADEEADKTTWFKCFDVALKLLALTGKQDGPRDSGSGSTDDFRRDLEAFLGGS